jgi:hypothetical protein
MDQGSKDARIVRKLNNNKELYKDYPLLAAINTVLTIYR